MAETTFEITVNNIQLARDLMDQAKDEILEVLGATIERYATDLCPVGTPESTGIPGYKGGSLKSTLRHEKKDADTMEIKAGGIDGLYKFVNYAVYVECGTVKMAAKPYLKPAVENHLSEYENIVRRALGK